MKFLRDSYEIPAFQKKSKIEVLSSVIIVTSNANKLNHFPCSHIKQTSLDAIIQEKKSMYIVYSNFALSTQPPSGLQSSSRCV
jgi:hypothetical protein